jgi:hypothetical protein
MTADTATVTFVATHTPTNSTITKVYSISKSKSGGAGTAAKTVTLSASGQTFKYNSAGTATPSAQTITFTVNLQNVTGTASYSITGYNSSGTSTGSIKTGTNNSFTLTNSEFLTNANTVNAVVTVTLDSITDTITVIKVADGEAGTNAITATMSKPAAVLPASSAGVVSSYLNSGTKINVYDGTTQLVYTANTPTAGYFSVATAQQSPANAITVKAYVGDGGTVVIGGGGGTVTSDPLAGGTAGLAAKFFNGSWRSEVISTGNVGTLPLTTADDSSNVTYTAGSTGLPSNSHGHGVNIWSSINYTSPGDTYGFIAIGYFKPPSTGDYLFETGSDDYSVVWLGDIAVATSGRSSTNATVYNVMTGGGVTGQGVYVVDNTNDGNSNITTVTLNADTWYAIRIVHEEGTGGDSLTFRWKKTTDANWTSDLSQNFKVPAPTSGSYNYINTTSGVLPVTTTSNPGTTTTTTGGGVTIQDHESMNDTVDAVTLTYPITAVSLAGDAATLSVSQTVAKAKEGVGAYSMTLSPTSYSIPATNAGAVTLPDTTNAITQARVYYNGADDTQNWSFYVSGAGTNIAWKDSDSAATSTTGIITGSLGGTNLYNNSNLISQSSNVNWIAGQITAPDGVSSAGVLRPTNVAAVHQGLVNSTPSTFSINSTYTVSGYIKQQGTAVTHIQGFPASTIGGITVSQWTYDFTTGKNTNGAGTTTFIKLSNGWVRFAATFTTPSTVNGGTAPVASNYFFQVSNSTNWATAIDGAGTNSGVYIWGVQIETGSVATGLTQTSGSVASGTRGLVIVNSLNQDTSFLDITAYRPGVGSLVQRYSITKAKQGQDGSAVGGSTGPRNASGYVYYNTASTNTPTSPAGSSFDFSTASFGTLTSGWGTTFSVPAIADTTGKKYWAVRYSVSEATFQGTQTITFSDSFVWTNFDGLVTFTNLAAGKDGSGTVSKTLIDGASIKTGSITTNSLTVTGFGDSAILNAGFEDVDGTDSTMPAKWIRGQGIITNYHTRDNNSYWIYRDTADSFSGSASMVLNNDAGGGGQAVALYSEVIPVSAGDVWYVSCRVKSLSGSVGSSEIFVRIVKEGTNLSDNGSNHVLCGIEAVTAPVNSWQQFSGQGTIPAGWKNARVMVLKWSSGNTTGFRLDEVEFKKATGGAQISELSANKITAGTITVDKLNFTNVGTNFVQNAACLYDIAGYEAGQYATNIYGYLDWSKDSHGNDYRIAPGYSAHRAWYRNYHNLVDGVWQNTGTIIPQGTSLGWCIAPGRMPVKAGDRVEASVYVSSHRTTSSLRIYYYNQAGAYLSETTLASESAPNYANGTLANWTNARLAGFTTIPSTSAGQTVSFVSVGCAVFAYPTSDPYNSDVFFTNWFLSYANPNQTTFTPWNEGTITSNSNNIAADAVTFLDAVQSTSAGTLSLTLPDCQIGRKVIILLNTRPINNSYSSANQYITSNYTTTPTLVVKDSSNNTVTSGSLDFSYDKIITSAWPANTTAYADPSTGFTPIIENILSNTRMGYFTPPATGSYSVSIATPNGGTLIGIIGKR